MVAGGLVVGCITQQYIREADKGEGWGLAWSGWEVISNWTGKLEKPQGLVAEFRLQKSIHCCSWIA